MSLWTRETAARSKDPSLSLEIHKMEGENFYRLSSASTHAAEMYPNKELKCDLKRRDEDLTSWCGGGHRKSLQESPATLTIESSRFQNSFRVDLQVQFKIQKATGIKGKKEDVIECRGEMEGAGKKSNKRV